MPTSSPIPRLIDLCISFLVHNLDSIENVNDIDSEVKSLMMNMMTRDKQKNFTLIQMLKLFHKDISHFDMTGMRVPKDAPFHQFLPLAHLLHLRICNNNELTDFTMENILQYCPDLEELVLNGSPPRVTDVTLENIVRYCEKLKVLSIVGCIGISGKVFESNKTTITSFFSSTPKKPPNSKPPVIMKMPCLLNLDISGCKSINLQALSPARQIFPNLQTLSLSKIFLTDEDAAAFLKTMPPSLNTLDVSFSQVSTRTFDVLCNTPMSAQIQNLCLKACRCIVTSSFVNSQSSLFTDLFLRLPNLRNLDISQCYQLGEYDFLPLTAVEPPTKVANGLVSLDISNCLKLTRESVFHLSKLGCSITLKELNLNGNQNIQEETLLEAMDWFPSLQMLNGMEVKQLLKKIKPVISGDR